MDKNISGEGLGYEDGVFSRVVMEVISAKAEKKILRTIGSAKEWTTLIVYRHVSYKKNLKRSYLLRKNALARFA